MTASPPSILVVEDNAETRLLLKHILATDYATTVVESVDAAMQACSEQSFHLLLLDINLGGQRTGTDLLHALRTPPQSVGAPAIALTAYAMPGDRQRFEKEGFDAYVSKPFSQDDLLGAIRDCLAASA